MESQGTHSSAGTAQKSRTRTAKPADKARKPVRTVRAKPHVGEGPPLEKYARGELSWREQVRDVMVASGKPLSAALITSGVAQHRGIGRARVVEYRYIEKCIGVMLSRFQNRAIDSDLKLSVIGLAQRGRLYALAPLDKNEEPYPPKWGRGLGANAK